MAVQTIDEVVAALDAIIQRSYDDASRLGYFAALYWRVTCAVRDGIHSGSFPDCNLMEQLDVVFASRYLDALAAYQAGGIASKSWIVAFQGCNDPGLLALQHLLCGMNAHINLDLGIAAAQVSPGEQLAGLKPDFDAINAVLAGLTGTVAAELAAVSPLIGDLEKIDPSEEIKVAGFDMTAARDAAWVTAERIAFEPSFLHQATIDGLDLAVSVAGRALLYPDHDSPALTLIQQAEVKDVRRVIDVLSQAGSAGAARAATNT